jgi:aspartate racemase
MHTPSLHRYVECLDAGDLDGVAALMLESAHKLAHCGADFLICPDNTIHQAFARMAPRSPLPWLHIAQVVAREAAARGYRRIGILGTHWLVASEVYPEHFEAQGLAWAKPPQEERIEVGRLIMDELVYGVQTPQQVSYLQGVIRGLQAQGCDAVVLGCTELPLVLSDANSPLPTLDSTRLLARAALVHALRVTP